MTKIKVMDELLANKIAAGEVVERCVSVVKELVENSIDANATEIKIELKEAGTLEMKIIDNGDGMEKEDAVLAFQRHATSKLRTEDDLYHIHTLGFRGEALASISSVSQIILKTSSGSEGTQVKINGGIINEVAYSDARKGTIISVNNLFYNTPARLKHMKSLYTELASVTDFVNKIALSNPEIKFILSNNGNILLNTDGSNNLLKTIKDVFGIDVARRMLEVSGYNDDYNVSGYISLPEVHKSNRNAMVILVNGRIVRNQELNRVINDSYHSYKPDNRYPVVVLNIDVDPSLIDVNIHPTKMDIKFSKMEELISLIQNIIETKIKNHNLIPKIEVPTIKPNIEVKNDYIEKPVYKEQILKFNIKEETEEYIVMDDYIKEEDTVLFEEIKMVEMYPVGLVHGTYIIAQNEKGMYLIDQHAAKERINYEYYKKKLGNPNDSTTKMMIPLTMELTNSEFIIIKEKFEELKNIGIEIEEFGLNSVIIKAHPTWLPIGKENESIKRIIEIVISLNKTFSIEKFNEMIATMLSCKMAIKANQNITKEEMEYLISDLRKCENPFNCPHGRPTTVFYSTFDLEKLFKRSGF